MVVPIFRNAANHLVFVKNCCFCNQISVTFDTSARGLNTSHCIWVILIHNTSLIVSLRVIFHGFISILPLNGKFNVTTSNASFLSMVFILKENRYTQLIFCHFIYRRQLLRLFVSSPVY